MDKKIKVFFTGYSPYFIDNDYRLLNKHFTVKKFDSPTRNVKTLLYLFSLIKGVKECDLTFSWFANLNSALTVFFAKLFRKKSIVVIGGYDASYEPSIKYGAFTKSTDKIPAKFVLKNADLLLPVSNFTKNEVLKRVKPKEIKVVYNGVNIEKFKPSTVEKEKIITTIGQATKKSSKLKGLGTFAKVSTYFPDYKFVIIGKYDIETLNELKKINKNLIFTGLIPHDEVLKWLQKSVVYCQLSYIESFGLGIAEAMSCGCIPVITDRGAIKELVSDYGYYVQYNNKNATIVAIKKALENKDISIPEIRNYIVQNFSLEKRERHLVELIK